MCQDAGFYVREEGLDQSTCGQTADIIGAEIMQKPGAVASSDKEAAEGKHAAGILRKALLLDDERTDPETGTPAEPWSSLREQISGGCQFISCCLPAGLDDEL